MSDSVPYKISLCGTFSISCHTCPARPAYLENTDMKISRGRGQSIMYLSWQWFLAFTPQAIYRLPTAPPPHLEYWSVEISDIWGQFWSPTRFGHHHHSPTGRGTCACCRWRRTSRRRLSTFGRFAAAPPDRPLTLPLIILCGVSWNHRSQFLFMLLTCKCSICYTSLFLIIFPRAHPGQQEMSSKRNWSKNNIIPRKWKWSMTFTLERPKILNLYNEPVIKK